VTGVRNAGVGNRVRVAAVGVLTLVSVALLVGCGGSSKPAYCSDVTTFTQSVDQLKSDITNPSALVKQVKKVVSSGQAAVTAVKSDFAPQTSAVKSSLAALQNSAKQLTSSSTRGAAITAIPGQVQAVSSAATDLANAAKSGKCS